jgi:hypothetical protein
MNNNESECQAFEVLDFDEETGEILNAMCSDKNPCWPNCNKCMNRWEYKDIN